MSICHVCLPVAPSLFTAMYNFLHLILYDPKLRFSHSMLIFPLRYQHLFERMFIPTLSLLVLLVMKVVYLVLWILFRLRLIQPPKRWWMGTMYKIPICWSKYTTLVHTFFRLPFFPHISNVLDTVNCFRIIRKSKCTLRMLISPVKVFELHSFETKICVNSCYYLRKQYIRFFW